MRALILRHVDARIDALSCSDGDRALAQAVGMIAAGALLLLWAASQIDAHLARLNPMKETP